MKHTESVPGNRMILASAGAGKTYALTMRLARLLLLGFEPSRIVALTFTRLAAGEFLTELLRLLAEASRNPEACDRLARETEIEGIMPEHVLACLKKVLRDLHQLNLGTLDGFFARILRAFPYEFGTSGTFEIMDEQMKQEARARALADAFSHAVPQERKRVAELFRQTSAGDSERSATRRLLSLVSDNHELFLASGAVADGVWGDARAIWGDDGCPWPDSIDVPALVEQVAKGVDLDKVNATAASRWELFRKEMPDWHPGMLLPRKVENIVSKAMEALGSLEAGEGVLQHDRATIRLSRESAMALAKLVRGIAGHEIHRKLVSTSAFGKILERFEASYDATCRMRGHMVFADFPLLLTGRLPRLRKSGLSTDVARLDMAWRLDATIDHWLFDEFQDTSRVQWAVLADAVDEVVSDQSGRRSLFYVGDVKQSIYGWRGGDSRLFQEVYERYRQGGTISQGSLSNSWRSGPQIISMVNRVFGNATLLSSLFPDDVASRWKSVWQKHDCSPKTRKLDGYAAMLQIDEKCVNAYEVLAELLHRINPLAKGLTCAVIVQTNKAAAECVECLRSADIPVSRDGDVFPGRDNVFAMAVKNLFQLAVHPGDSLAKEYLSMSPVDQLRKEDSLSWNRFAESFRKDAFQIGLASAVSQLMARIESTSPLDPFNHERALDVLRIARNSEKREGYSTGQFVARLDASSRPESASSGQVQVMTVHKAKGLGFDVVFLPDLGGNTLEEMRDGFAVHQKTGGVADWVLDLPRAAIRDCDPLLAGHADKMRKNACFENFCKLYVAMTRAKRVQYLIAPKPGRTSNNFARWLDDSLSEGEAVRKEILPNATCDVVAEFGDPYWYGVGTPAEFPLPMDPPQKNVQTKSPIQQTHLMHPSLESQPRIIVGQLFRQDTGSGAGFGRMAHEALADIEWWEDDADRMTPPVSQHAPSNEEVVSLLRSALSSEPVRNALAHPGGDWRLFREMPFDAVVDGRHVAGVMDRLLVHFDGENQPSTAIVQDFKTDSISDSPESLQKAVAVHKTQLHSYRSAAASILGIPAGLVQGQLIFLRPGVVHTL